MFHNQNKVTFTNLCFVFIFRVCVVQDTYHPVLLEQWDLFDKRKTSENDRPDIFPSDQLFIVFEFEECGTDLEAFKVCIAPF